MKNDLRKRRMLNASRDIGFSLKNSNNPELTKMGSTIQRATDKFVKTKNFPAFRQSFAGIKRTYGERTLKELFCLK